MTIGVGEHHSARARGTGSLQKQIRLLIAIDIAGKDSVLVRRPLQAQVSVRYRLTDSCDLSLTIRKQQVVIAGSAALKKDVRPTVAAEIGHDGSIDLARPGNAQVVGRPGLEWKIRPTAVGSRNAARLAHVFGDVQDIGLAVAVKIAGIEIVILGAPVGGCLTK